MLCCPKGMGWRWGWGREPQERRDYVYLEQIHLVVWQKHNIVNQLHSNSQKFFKKDAVMSKKTLSRVPADDTHLTKAFLRSSFACQYPHITKCSLSELSLLPLTGASQVALVVKNSPANVGHTRSVDSIPGLEDPLEKGMAIHSSVLAWRIPCLLLELPKGKTRL